MPAIGNIILSTESSEAEILIDGVAMPVRVRRSARARAYKLTIDGLRGELRLSLPARANLKRALGWAQGHEDWVRAQMAVTPAVTLLGDGATFPLEGREVRICWIATRAAAGAAARRPGRSAIAGG